MTPSRPGLSIRRTPSRPRSTRSPRRATHRSRCRRIRATLWWFAGACGYDGTLLPFVRSLQSCDLNLLHLKHCLHDALRFFGIAVAQHFFQGGGDDLPPQTELIFEPAAWSFLSACGKLLPERIHFFLRLAV